MNPDGRGVVSPRDPNSTLVGIEAKNPPKTPEQKQAERVALGRENLGRDTIAEKAARKEVAEKALADKVNRNNAPTQE